LGERRRIRLGVNLKSEKLIENKKKNSRKILQSIRKREVTAHYKPALARGKRAQTFNQPGGRNVDSLKGTKKSRPTEWGKREIYGTPVKGVLNMLSREKALTSREKAACRCRNSARSEVNRSWVRRKNRKGKGLPSFSWKKARREETDID